MSEKPRKMVTRLTVEEMFAEGVPLHFLSADLVCAGGVVSEIDHTNGADIPEGSLLICAPFEPGVEYPSSLLGACERCTRMIVYRKNAPILKRICTPCAIRQGFLD